MANGGRQANKTGNSLERFVAFILDDKGYQRISPAREFFAFVSSKQPIYATQCIAGKDYYNRNWRVDFIVYHPEKWPNCLVIECKWQAISGTVEQKYPFVVQSIKKNIYPAIVILDGGGYSDEAKNWLCSQAGSGNLIDVMDQGGFQRFAAQLKL